MYYVLFKKFIVIEFVIQVDLIILPSKNTEIYIHKYEARSLKFQINMRENIQLYMRNP